MKKLCKLKKIIAIIFFSLLAVITIIFTEIDTHFNHEKVSFVAVGDNLIHPVVYNNAKTRHNDYCLLYTSDAADDTINV